MTDIQPILQRLGLERYYEAFLAEGFDTWETVLDIQENDLKILDVKLGHRRRLQRAIAEFRGISNDRPLRSPPRDTPPEDAPRPDASVQASSSKEPAYATATDQKRKYRRHPKPDENAPEKPPSAYVLFSNRVREEVKAESLSFTEIARLVGERWQKLDPNQKEPFESHAGALKESYNKELTDYKKTDAYKDYMQYLADFKAKNAAQSDVKRPKLEHHGSSSLSGSGNSIDTVDSQSHQTSGHARQQSIGSASVQSQVGPPALSLLSTLPMTNITGRRRGSPPYQLPQERRFPTQSSGQSSLSEESLTPRFDSSEALSRTAKLSLDTPSRGTPSPSTTTATSGRQDYGYRSGSQQWPSRQATHDISAPEAAITSPGSTASSMPASAVGADQWRNRSAEARSFYTGGPSAPAQQTSSMPISQLIDSYRVPDAGTSSSQRILPPPGQPSSTTSTISVTGFASMSSSHTLQPYHSTHESMAFRRGPVRSPPNQSESEAADTLAALAEYEHSSSQSRTPRPPHGQG